MFCPIKIQMDIVYVHMQIRIIQCKIELFITRFYMYSSASECSHMKALKWYTDAVRNETKYLATKCEDCMLYLSYKYCQENDQIYFGPHVDTKK